MASKSGNPHLVFENPSEEIQFFKNVIHNLPAFIAIQQMDDLQDHTTNHNVWANHQVIDFLGYDRTEMDKIGFKLFLETMHPDDLPIIGSALNKFDNDSDVLFAGVYRLKPKNKPYKWVIGAIKVFERKNGVPWRFLNITLDIDQLHDTQEQLIALTRENLQFKNQLKISVLTKREKQIVRFISNGLTDKEIARTIFISPSTVKTHRNNILRKLNLKNAAALSNFASETGLS
jgi:DNA-binding CsgD family transcriptional regulator